MKTSIISLLGGAVLSVALFAAPVRAVLVPTLSLATVNNGSQVAVTVFGADPNAPISLFYPAASSLASASLGTTNGSGYFTTTVSPSAYAIAAGAPVYAIVNGAQSQTQLWPSTTAPSSAQTMTGSLVLSQSSVAVQAGQSTAISASNPAGSVGALSIQSNTNSAVANVSISGSLVIIAGNSQGASAATICSTNAGCAALSITVTQALSGSSLPSAQATGAISLSTTNVAMNQGEQRLVTISGLGSYYVSNNSNGGVVSTSLSGSTLTLTANAAGTAIVSVCGTNGSVTSCVPLSVTVNQTNASTDASQPASVASVSPSSVDLTIGQMKTASLSSSRRVTGIYYVASNSNTAAVTASVSGSALNVFGVAYGGATISVCEQGGTQCASFYAYVSPALSGGTTVPATTPSITSVTLSSNGVGGSFMGSGATITATWSAGENVSRAEASFAGSPVTVYGSGSGPFMAKYTLGGQGSVPVALSVTGQSGLSSSVRFTMNGAQAAVPAAPAPASSGATFTAYLKVGSTGEEVRALQTVLTRVGVYTGPVTGTYGPLTEAAVKRYQTKHGLDAIGVVGPSTRATLNAE